MQDSVMMSKQHIPFLSFFTPSDLKSGLGVTERSL